MCAPSGAEKRAARYNRVLCLTPICSRRTNRNQENRRDSGVNNVRARTASERSMLCHGGIIALTRQCRRAVQAIRHVPTSRIERKAAPSPRSPFDSISFAENESESKNRRKAILNNTFARLGRGTCMSLLLTRAPCSAHREPFPIRLHSVRKERIGIGQISAAQSLTTRLRFRCRGTPRRISRKRHPPLSARCDFAYASSGRSARIFSASLWLAVSSAHARRLTSAT